MEETEFTQRVVLCVSQLFTSTDQASESEIIVCVSADWQLNGGSRVHSESGAVRIKAVYINRP